MYRVFFEGSPDRQAFLFRNYDDAFNFASMAVENGTYQDFHYMEDERIEELPRPIKVTVQGVEE